MPLLSSTRLPRNYIGHAARSVSGAWSEQRKAHRPCVIKVPRARAGTSRAEKMRWHAILNEQIRTLQIRLHRCGAIIPQHGARVGFGLSAIFQCRQSSLVA
jgi:hypothetical protein